MRVVKQRFEQLRLKAPDRNTVDHRHRRREIAGREKLGAGGEVGEDVADLERDTTLVKELLHHPAGASAFIGVEDNPPFGH